MHAASIVTNAVRQRSIVCSNDLEVDATAHTSMEKTNDCSTVPKPSNILNRLSGHLL